MQIAEVETFRYFRIRQRGWGREKLRSSSFQHTSETIESSNSTAIFFSHGKNEIFLGEALPWLRLKFLIKALDEKL